MQRSPMMNNQTATSKPVVVVTGGAQNIGLSIAIAFAENGYLVVVADLNPPPETFDQLHFQATNITQESSVCDLFAMVKERYGSVRVLVNNAGIALEKTLVDTPLDDWRHLMQVNVDGVFLCSKHAILQMRQAKQPGVIINIGSLEGLGANPAHAAYAASKGAVHALTRNIAIDHGADYIRCNAIAPGWISTSFNDRFIQQLGNPDKALKAIEQLHPLGQLGTPEDVAQLAVWLASDNAAFINGQVITLDGGRSAQLPLPVL